MFHTRVVVVAPGEQRAVDHDSWRRAIVLVASGSIELACEERLLTFGRGETFWLDGLPACALRNAGEEACVLVGIARPEAA